VIIHNFNVEDIPIFEPEADTPLLIDPDAPVFPAVSRKSFQSIARWGSQEIDRRGAVQQN
jgi:hypothetical protein